MMPASAQGGQGHATPAGSQIPGDGPGRFLDRSHQLLHRSLVQQPVGGLIVGVDGLFVDRSDQIFALAIHQLVAVVTG